MRPLAAFQGVPGAFSHEACLAMLPDHQPEPFTTFDEVFEAVREGRCDVAFVPLENTIAGPVPEVARLLREAPLPTAAEHAWPVRLQLMAAPGVALEEIRTAASHPMALAQCGGALAALNLRPEPWFDTAGAARDLAVSGERSRAAVASRTAAALYGLTILREDIEDTGGNQTRFLVLRPH